MHFAAHTEVSSSQPHVLVVEDETITRAALRALLMSCGFETTAVASGEEALRVAPQQAEPLVALVDLDLPGMNGAELVRELRRCRPDARSIILTAASRDRVRELFGENMLHMRKPIDFEYLLSVLTPAN